MVAHTYMCYHIVAHTYACRHIYMCSIHILYICIVCTYAWYVYLHFYIVCTYAPKSWGLCTGHPGNQHILAVNYIGTKKQKNMRRFM